MEACESGLRRRPDQFRDSAPAGCKPLLNRCFFVCHRPLNLPQEYGGRRAKQRIRIQASLFPVRAV